MGAKDFLGNELSVGDKVIFCLLHYRKLKVGVIEKITAQMVFISWGPGEYQKVRQFHSQVIKVDLYEKAS